MPKSPVVSPGFPEAGAFAARPDDVFIVTYPRSGTTWMQMIMYQLTTNGEMAFMHISQHVPFLERGLVRGHDFSGMKSPRVFKTHGRMSQIDDITGLAGRYIYVCRGGRDVAISYYHMYKHNLGFPGSFDEFFSLFMDGKVQYGRWFDHLQDAFQFSARENVLIVRYEDLVKDWDAQIGRIAVFLRLAVSAEKQKVVNERCSFEFMKKHEMQFDHMTELLWERMQNGGNNFLRSGKIGSGLANLNPSQEAQFLSAATRANIANTYL